MSKQIAERLQVWIKEATRLDQDIIILGNFNESDKENGKKKILLNTLIKFDLQDIHACIAGNDRIDTWKSSDNTTSRIDYIFSNLDIL